MFFIATLKILKTINFKKKIMKVLCELLFCFFHVVIFYLLLYKIDYGILNYYIVLFLIIGGLFCQLLYFLGKNP